MDFIISFVKCINYIVFKKQFCSKIKMITFIYNFLKVLIIFSIFYGRGHKF